MKKVLLSFLIFLICLSGGLAWATPNHESSHLDATPIVAYGKDGSGNLYPIAVDSDGKVSTSGGGAGAAGGWTDDGTFIHQTTLTDNVGIGTTTPVSPLDLNGGVGTMGELDLTGAGTGTITSANGIKFTISGSNNMVLNTDGTLSLGGTGGGSDLNMYGGSSTLAAIRIVDTGAQTSGTSTAAGTIAYEDDGTALVAGSRMGFTIYGGAKDTSHNMANSVAANGYAAETWTSSSSPGEYRIETTPSGSTSRVARVLVDKNGNVGIGTTAANFTLDVNGTAKVTGFKLTTSPTNGYVLTADANGVGTWAASSGGSSQFITVASVGIGTTSNVGIGTLNPTHTLEVIGTVNATAFAGDGSALTNLPVGSGSVGIGTITTGTIQAMPSYSAITTLAPSGSMYTTGTNVGIGTNTIANLLTVSGSDATVYTGPNTSWTPRVTITNRNNTASAGAELRFNTFNSTPTEKVIAKIMVFGSNKASGSENGHMIFATSTGGSLLERMRIDGAGNVGIGTTNTPSNLLSVNGSVEIGTTYTRTTAPTNGLIVSGNVGIGTSNPVNLLDLSGGAVVGSGYTGLKTAPANGLGIQGNVGIGTYNTNAPLVISGGHIHSIDTAPTVASNDCGSTAQGTITSKSTDLSGSVTVGTLAVTSCAVTFAHTWTNAPNCIVIDDSTILTVRPSTTTTKLTIASTTSMSSDVITWICSGNE